jgi:ubiquinone/menaquinone biosynthesis C-methylase UbiE
MLSGSSLRWTLKSLLVNKLLTIPFLKAAVTATHVTGIDGNRERARDLFRYFDSQVPVHGKVVLELGPGKTLETLEQAALAGCRQAIAADVTAYHTEERATAYGVTYLLFDGEQLPLEDNSVDVVWAHYCMQHFRNPSGMLNEIARVTRPAGHLLCRVDLRDHYFMFEPGNEYHCLQYSSATWRHIAFNRSSYVNRLRVSDWERLLRQSGFECEQLTEHRSDEIYRNNHQHSYLQRFDRRDIATFRFDGRFRYVQSTSSR